MSALRVLAFALCVAGVAAPSVAGAVAPGARIPVTVLERSPALADSVFEKAGVAPSSLVVGRLVALNRSMIDLDDEDCISRTIPREMVAQFEVSSGRRARTGRGAVLGMLVGLVGGVGVGVYLVESEDFGGRESGFVPVALGAGGALAGLGFGALVGSLIHTESWHAQPDLVRGDPP